MLKVKNNKKKYAVLDVSWIIYNSTYSSYRTCSACDPKNPDPDCHICEGNGKYLLQSSNGVITGGLYGLFNYVYKYIDSGYNVELIFDPPKSQLDRSKLIDDYKGNRGEKKPFIIKQMELAPELFVLTNKVACFTSEGDESDDVIAIRSTLHAENGCDVVIVGVDKDFFPLLAYDNIKMYKDKMIFGKKEFHAYMKKKNGVSFPGPHRFNEVLAIVGDQADNYNLIKGLGWKAAEYFINKYDNITDLWDDWDSIPSKYQKKLISSCNGKICKKCNKCELYKGEITYLKDELELSLKLAYLNMEAKYYQLENTNNYTELYNKLKELDLYFALNNIHKLF
jgi:protein Xni